MFLEFSDFGSIFGEGVKICENDVAFDVARVRNFDMGWVGVHVFDFCGDGRGIVAEVNAVAERLTHFGFTVDTGQASANLTAREENFRLYQNSFAVKLVHFADDFASLFEHRCLVFADRN